ncbi:MAG: hypothetical protein JWN99_1718 [Ilumatobacteraceae bacterium]|nr:hypothetical protein [Ilumatobacteraceae bacterium]
MVGWVCVLLGFAAVSRTSRNLGLSTWWLGPSSARRSIIVQLVPFVPGAALVVLAARNQRFLPYFGAIGSVLLGAIAAGDLDRFHRLALTEFIIAGAALLISVSSVAGQYRRAHDNDAADGVSGRASGEPVVQLTVEPVE